VYYILLHVHGRRLRERQPERWVATTNPTAPSRPFYTRLNQLAAEHQHDDFVERSVSQLLKHLDFTQNPLTGRNFPFRAEMSKRAIACS
jgi:hypothetical protein